MAVNQNIIAAAQKAWQDANKRGDKAGMDAAHKAAEAERAKGGYSGGSDGSQRIPTSNTGSGNTSSGSGSSGGSGTVNVGSSGNAQKGHSVGTIVNTAGGQYKIVDKNTPGAAYNSASGYYSIKVPTAGNVSNTKSTQTTSQRTPTSFTRNGQQIKGYIVNGLTYDEQGNRAKSGDLVTAGGKTYLMTGNGGVDITSAFKTDIMKEEKDDKGNVKLVSQSRPAYIVNGKTYDTMGNTLSVGDIVKGDGGKYFQMTNNGGMEYAPPIENRLTDMALFEDPKMQTFIDALMQYGVVDDPQLASTLSLDEALAMANQKLNPMYNQAMDSTMKGLDEQALKSGFYGQLPTEALKRQTAGSLEIEKLNAIYELANQLFGQSEESAYNKLSADTQQQQNKIGNLLNMLGLYQDNMRYGDTRSDMEDEKAMAEARLTGKYKGNPTLDFLDYQRLVNNQRK